MASKFKKLPTDVLNSEDVRWAELLRRSIDGLAAIAEAQAEGCETEWVAMHNGLETVLDIFDGIIKDYKERIGGAE